MLGNAPCSFSGDILEAQVEGIPADDSFGLYGGSVANDSSGSMRYISIRHGGALIGEGNEINLPDLTSGLYLLSLMMKTIPLLDKAFQLLNATQITILHHLQFLHLILLLGQPMELSHLTFYQEQV